MLELLSGLFSFGFNIISIGFRLFLAFTVGMSMTAKGRNGLLWGIATLFLPYLAIIVFFIPRKTPKLDGRFRNDQAFYGRNDIISSIMALSAMVAKADGHVSLEEIKLIKNYVQRQFRVPASELNRYEGAFNYGKTHPEDYGSFTTLLRQYGNYNVLLSISYLLVGIAIQDGSPSQAEEQILRQIIGGLGLNEYVYQSIKNHYMGGSRRSYGYQQSYGGYQQPYESQSDLIQKYSNILGVDKDADMSTIKKAYRKMVKAHHPDNMAKEGMPDEYQDFANKRISEINEAYDYLKNLKTATA